ncbi:hypothetical protein JCM8547_000086 [Rhodosporidiobolus lusitaniae]
MPCPDWPRTPPSYLFSPSAASLAVVELATPLPSTSPVNRRTALRAAATIVLSAHAVEGVYAMRVEAGEVVAGELEDEGEVGSLLRDVERMREQGLGEEVRLSVLYGATNAAQQTPLQLVTVEADSCLKFRLSFDRSLLPTLEAQWFLSHVTTAFSSLLSASSSDRLSSLALAPPAETAILERYSTDSSFSPSSAYPADIRALPDFFLHAASLYPDDSAIHFLPDPSSPTSNSLVLSFSQTLFLARHLSSHLISCISSSPTLFSAWKAGNLVLPVCVSKSHLLPLSLLAIALSGCGYLALEPSFPENRKRGIAEELEGQGMLAPVAVVETAEAEKGRWESWMGCSEKDGRKKFERVLDPGEVLGAMVEAAAGGATVEELQQKFPLDEPEGGWPVCREEGLAYVIYTSGTTGKPKGIAVEHRQVAAFLRNYRGVFGRARGERVLQFPSYAFDVSVMNIWDCFAHGSTLCITTPSSLFSSLATSISALRCTLVDLTPTIAALLFEHDEAQPRDGETVKEAWERAGFRIKQVNTGGERVEKSVREKWRERGVRVVIDYGPTHTTVGVISNRSVAPSPPAPFSLPIGKPTGNTRIAILSSSATSSLKPVPLGCIGEICVLGPQVTRGYILPKLNEGVFVTLPERVEGVGKKGERLYRTGDLGRWVVADWEVEGEKEGWVECLGRRDGQVKVNGLRIEIGEIEAQLSSQANPFLLRGIVDVFDTDSISPSLVAYLELSPSFTAFPSSSPSPALNGSHHTTSDVSVLPVTSSPLFLSLVDSLKQHLAEKLPAYMVPRYWLAVNRIPTQGMGKADRKVLTSLAVQYDWRAASRKNRSNGLNGNGGEGQEEKEKTFTRDEQYAAARRAWAKVLRLSEEDAAGIADQDEFVKLGGDSIRFMKLVAVLRSSGYEQLKYKDVVDASTLSQCAAALSRSSSSTSSSPSASNGSTPYKPFSLIPSASLSSLLSELSSHSPSLPQSRVSDAYPTAPSQDALLAPSFDSPIGHYYAQAIYAVEPTEEELSFEKLQKGVREMVRRYEALRSVFVVTEESGTCVVVLREEDGEVRERTEAVRVKVEEEEKMDEAVSEWLRTDRERFGFRWGQLHLSFALFETPSGKRKFGWGMHHAMSDGWTLELLTADLRSTIFNLPLPTRPPFSSVAAWWHSSSSLSAETASFWRSYLTSATPLSYPSQALLNGETLATTGAAILHWTGELDGLTQRHGITPAIATRLAISLALSVHSGKGDVTVGIVRSGRDIDVQDADEVVGPCVSVLPSRIRFASADSSSSSSPSLLSLARSEASHDRLARIHQRVTLPQLVQTCALASRSSLFSTLVTFQSLAEHDPPSSSDEAPWPIRQPPERIHMPTNYSLSFEVTPQLGRKDEYELACFFDESLIGKEEVERVLRTVGKVLDWVVEAPCTEVEEVRRKLGRGGEVEERKEESERKVEEDGEENGEVGGELLSRVKKEWAAVLRIEEDEFAVEETFSSLGGDSIATMRLAVRLQKAGLAIPTTKLAKLPTVRKQATWLSQRAGEEEGRKQ